MALDRILPAFSMAATFMGMGMVVLGQAIFDPFAHAAERLVGGSILITAAVLIVRWTFKLWSETRQAIREDRAAALERDRLHMAQLAELNAQLITERQLRIGLERAGISDRRDPDIAEEPLDPEAGQGQHTHD